MKKILPILIISMILAPMVLIGSSSEDTKQKSEYIDLTVEEVLTMLTTQDDGIQIPIDVRRDDEWKAEHLNTQSPQDPIHFSLSRLQDPQELQIFFELFEGKEIILYCRTGSRSVTAANILLENEFNGTIYNMLGGITAWKAADCPTHPNTLPSLPTINGPAEGKAETAYNYTIQAEDPDEDQVYICVNWSDDSGEVCLGPYNSGETVTISHTWQEQGTFIVKAKTQDAYGDESEWQTLEVSMPRQRSCLFEILASWNLEKIPILNWLLMLFIQ